ncbi:MAG: hypothetical protein WBM40_23365 [Thiohalocapsa sp.]
MDNMKLGLRLDSTFPACAAQGQETGAASSAVAVRVRQQVSARAKLPSQARRVHQQVFAFLSNYCRLYFRDHFTSSAEISLSMIRKRGRRRFDTFSVLITVLAIGMSLTLAYQVKLYYGGDSPPMAKQTPAGPSVGG